MDKKREYEFDLLRVLLCATVVIGHATYMNINTKFGGIKYLILMKECGISNTMFHAVMNQVTKWIYTFHMPAFFVLSGYFFGKQLQSGKWNLKNLIVNKWKSILLPCIFVWLIWNVPVKLISGYYDGIAMWKILLQIIFPYNVYLWYLETLFIVFILAYLLNKLTNSQRMIIILILWAVGMLIGAKELFRNWVPMGNPLKYILWFEVGIELPTLIKWFVEIGPRKKRVVVLMGFVYSALCIFYLHANTYMAIILREVVLPGMALVFLLIGCRLWIVTQNSDIMKEQIVVASGYTFGIYLWADPLNYLILSLAYTIGGIACFGNEMIAIIIWGLRVFVTPIIAVGIIKFLRLVRFPIKCY